MNISIYALVAGLLCYGICYSRSVAKAFPAEVPAGRIWCNHLLPLALLALLSGWFHFPLPLLYLLLYLWKLLWIFSFGGSLPWRFLLTNLSFLVFACAHLASAGIAAVCTGRGLSGVLLLPGAYTLCLLASLALHYGAMCFFFRREADLASLEAACAGEEFQNFFRFLWLCTGYLLVESVLCLFDSLPVYTPLFAVGGCVLMLALAAGFLRNVCEISKNAAEEAENNALRVEIERRRQSASDLRRSADYDALTGAYSRNYAMNFVRSLLEQGEAFTLAFVDLDRLKQINDTQGHSEGDRFLHRFVETLRSYLRGGDLLSRIGGDEFLILFRNCAPEAAAQRLASIRRAMSAHKRGSFSFSFGLSAAPRDGRDPDALLRAADEAMYADKRARQDREEEERC